MNRLQGRVALVTGAASGIGKATAQRLVEEGAAVLVTDIQTDAGEITVKELTAAGGRAAFIRHDVTSEADWEAAVARAEAEFGGLDILVNNAGMGDLAPIEETSLADWERTVSIDQTGVFLGMKVAAPALKRSGHGSVINISSIFGASARSRRTSRCTGRPRVSGSTRSTPDSSPPRSSSRPAAPTSGTA